VLVTAGAGGVGIWAVQLARLAGVEYIVTTCGPTNIDFVKSLGAHEVRDYTSSSGYLSGCGESFDLVLDCVGGSTLETAWTCAKPGGRVISVAIPANLKRPNIGVATGVQTVWFIVAASSDQLEKITELIELGFCKTAVDSIFAWTSLRKRFPKYAVDTSGEKSCSGFESSISST
jgi:NADPH:quinone reductase-like Zn-dependent oxidoreductase